MEPTESELTVAVDAAARVIYGQARIDFTPKFDELPPLEKNKYREAAVPIRERVERRPDDASVRAALEDVDGGDLGTVLTATVNAYSEICRKISASLES